MRIPIIATACLLLLVAAVSSSIPVSAFQKPTGEGFHPDFDLRERRQTGDGAEARADIAARFSERYGPGIVIRWGEVSHRPLFLFRPGTVLGTVPAGDRVAAVKNYLRAGEELFGLSATEIDELEPVAVFETAGTGAEHLRFVQRVDGISVFRGRVRFNLDELGGIINIGGEYFPGLRAVGTAEIGAGRALQVAASGIGLAGTVPPVASEMTEGERLTVFEAGSEYLESPAARLMLLPESADRARLVWQVIVWENVTGWDNQYRVLVDAETGEAVLRELMTLYLGPATPADAAGLVFDETPMHGPQVSRSFAGDPVASPLNWVTDGQQATRGNNVTARSDPTGNNNDATNKMAEGSKSYQFDFPFQNSYEEGSQWGPDEDAAITNVFYTGNLYHDYLYDLGFDEPSGNYQDDNFGRGGLGNDHVNADALDGAAYTFLRNNANWNPTNDGSPPRTNYYLWTDPPWERRDGSFDATVIFHEFTHGLSTRLVGGPDTQCLGGTQGGGMGEGWSDFFPVSYYSSETDDPAGPVVVGEYVTGRSDRGIRRYPYAHDMALSPLTYADLCDGGSCSVHDEGEIWASTLWDIRHDLIGVHGYTEGKRRIEQMVVDAMKLSPCSPNMVVMRDAVYQANEQRYGGEDLCLMRSAFARRGFGVEAWSEGTGSNAGAGYGTILPMGESLVFTAGKETLGWDAREGAVAYRVARGTFGSAAPNGFDDAACLGETAATEYTDADLPAGAGEGFYYLVAVEDGCFRSDYGSGSDDQPRIVSDCP